VSKIEDVIQLVDAGEKPILRFLKTSESGGLEKGQYGRVISHTTEEFDESHNTQIFTLDFSEYWQYNQQIERPVYWNTQTDHWNAPWHKTNGYPVDYRETYYLDETHCDEFEIVDYNDYNFGIHRAFISAVKRFDGTPNAVDNYQSWLEGNLIDALMESDTIHVLRDGELPW
jgi:hypothetical protein